MSIYTNNLSVLHNHIRSSDITSAVDSSSIAKGANNTIFTHKLFSSDKKSSFTLDTSGSASYSLPTTLGVVNSTLILSDSNGGLGWDQGGSPTTLQALTDTDSTSIATANNGYLLQRDNTDWKAVNILDFSNLSITGSSILPNVNASTNLGSTTKYFNDSYISNLNINNIIQPNTDNVVDLGTSMLYLKDGYFYNMYIKSKIEPNIDNNVDLGSSSKYFKDGYLYNMYIKTKVEPSTDNNVDLGSSTKSFNEGHVYNMYVNTKVEPSTDNSVDLGISTKYFNNGYINILSAGSLVPRVSNSSNIGSLSSYFGETYTDDLFVITKIEPTTTLTSNIGSSSKVFNNAFINSIYPYNKIEPASDGSVDLGSSGFYFNNGYINTLSIGSTIVPKVVDLDIGASSNKFRSVYAENVIGNTQLQVGSIIIQPNGLANGTYTLPSMVGLSGYVLKTNDTSGTLAWGQIQVTGNVWTAFGSSPYTNSVVDISSFWTADDEIFKLHIIINTSAHSHYHQLNKNSVCRSAYNNKTIEFTKYSGGQERYAVLGFNSDSSEITISIGGDRPFTSLELYTEKLGLGVI